VGRLVCRSCSLYAFLVLQTEGVAIGIFVYLQILQSDLWRGFLLRSRDDIDACAALSTSHFVHRGAGVQARVVSTGTSDYQFHMTLVV
jgi:hypothetical protein